MDWLSRCAMQSLGTVYDTSAGAGCNAITIGGTSAQLSALTVANLQNWQCSIHEVRTLT